MMLGNRAKSGVVSGTDSGIAITDIECDWGRRRSIQIKPCFEPPAVGGPLPLAKNFRDPN